MKVLTHQNDTPAAIWAHMLQAAVSLFINGFGVYLTIRAGIGAGPWDVFNLGLSNTFGILYGTASIMVSVAVLLIDIILWEPIGIAILIDSVVVGKSVDFFNWLSPVPQPETMFGGIVMGIMGLFIMGFTQYLYMSAGLGAGPRDTLLVGLKRRLPKIPIGVISIALLALVTLIGYLLGGPVGGGTLLFAFGAGPIMQLAFRVMRFQPTLVKHQHIYTTLRILLHRPGKAGQVKG